MRVKHDVNTKYSCQIGYPLDYSCAAYVHNAMYAAANLNAVCLSVEVEKGKLPEFIAANKAMGMTGFDLTMPHKSDIIQYLDECEESSRVFRCVNHVKWVGDKLVGVGLDGVGMGMAIEYEGVEIKDRDLLILGAGAVAGPIAADLCKRGARSAVILNRTEEKAAYIAEKLTELYGIRAESGVMNEKNLYDYAAKTDLLVQCTSLGAAGHEEDYEDVSFLDRMPSHAAVADVLYPRTRILDRARELGLKAIDGMGMMLHQQRAMMEFRFGITMPEESLDYAREALAEAVALRELRLEKKKA